MWMKMEKVSGYLNLERSAFYYCFIFFIIIETTLETQTYRMQLIVPSKAGKDTESSSPHFEWHIYFILLPVAYIVSPKNYQWNPDFFSIKNSKDCCANLTLILPIVNAKYVKKCCHFFVLW